MEIIHRFNGFYPFQLEVQSQHTYLQVLKENLTQQQISIYRKRYKILKNADQTNLVKLVKLYKEQSKLHLLYEYYPLSLEKYIQDMCLKCNDGDREQYKLIYDQFFTVMSSIIDLFIRFQIKTDVIIQNFVVSDINKGNIKLFVDPDAEFLGLELQNQKDEHKINTNKIFLQQYYLAEKKRIIMEFEQLLQKQFGINQTCTNNRPNFIINGSKLVFIHGNQHRNCDKQRKNEKIHELVSQKTVSKFENKKSTHNSSPVKTEKSQVKRDLKQKTLKKLSEIKNAMNRFQAKTPQMNTYDNYKHYPQTQDEIVFRPQKITNDKTALLEQNEYIQSLENEIQKIQETKRRKEDRQSAKKRADLINQINQIQQRNKNYKDIIHKDIRGHQHSDRMQETKSIDRFKGLKNNTILQKNLKNDCNSTKNDTRNHDKSGNSVESQQVTAHQQERKQQKTNKYRMKIVTSHQIQIEGKGQPQMKTAQNNMIQGIKSGKICISEQAQRPQRPKTVKLQTQQSNYHQQKKVKTVVEDIRPNSRNSDIASKSKKTNQLIQKINLKNNKNNQLSNSSHQPQQRQENIQVLPSYKSHIETLQNQQQKYYDKIKQAKIKAQQVLKQYARKKH